MYLGLGLGLFIVIYLDICGVKAVLNRALQTEAV